MRPYCNWVSRCVVALQTKNQKPKSFNQHQSRGASGLPYYCTSICVRFGCTRLANCVDLKPKKKKVWLLHRRPNWHLRARWWWQNSCTSTVPHPVRVAPPSRQLIETKHSHLCVQQVVWNKPVTPWLHSQLVGVESCVCHTCRQDVCVWHNIRDMSVTHVHEMCVCHTSYETCVDHLSRTSHLLIDRPFCPQPPRLHLLTDGKGNITVTQTIESVTRPPLCMRSGHNSHCLTESEVGQVDIAVTSTDRGGNTVTSKCDLSGDETVTPRKVVTNGSWSTESVTGCGDTTVTSVNRGDNTTICTCEIIMTKQLSLDRSDGDKTVSTQPSQQLVGVTLLWLQTTVVVNWHLRARWWWQNSCTSTVPDPVGVASPSPQLIERQHDHLCVQQVIWNKPVTPRLHLQLVRVETYVWHTCKRDGCVKSTRHWYCTDWKQRRRLVSNYHRCVCVPLFYWLSLVKSITKLSWSIINNLDPL